MKKWLGIVTVVVSLVGCSGGSGSKEDTQSLVVTSETITSNEKEDIPQIESTTTQLESSIKSKYYGTWYYVDSGEEIDILSTTDLNITEIEDDDNLLKVNKDGTVYYLIRSSIARTTVNGKIETLTPNDDSTLRSRRAYTGIGNINIILANILDSNIKEQTVTKSDGSFTTTTLPSGKYNLTATDSTNKLESIVELKSDINNIGNYKLTDKSLNNFKAELILNEEYILSDGNVHEAILRIHNISDNTGFGLSYDISLNTNDKVKSFTEGSVNSAGSVLAKSHKDIPISFSFNKLSSNMKEYSIDIVIKDALGNRWEDSFPFNVNKELVAILISTKSAPIKGTIKNPLTGKITTIDTADGKIFVPLLPEDKPYILVLSTSSFDSETFYSIGINKKPDDFGDFKDTSAHEPNNNETQSIALYTNNSIKSYIYGTDIDFWKIYTNEGVIVDKSLELFTNIDTPTVPTTPPSSLTATDGDYTDKIIINWSNTSNTTYFELYQATSSDGTYSKLSSNVIGTSYTATNVEGGITYYYKLKGCNDVGCSSYSNINSGYINVPNNAPIANAGVNQTINEGENITLDGSASSDSDGTINSYKWLENSTILSTNSIFSTTTLSGGIHEIALVVADDDGATNSDVVYVTVKATSNNAPMANAGANQTATFGDNLTLDASSSVDSDGTISQYIWKEGTTVLSISPSFSKSDFTVGEHTLTLTVTDDDGVSSSDTVVVMINEIPNKAPVITTTSFDVNENQIEVGIVQASDEDSNNLFYSLSGTDANTFYINNTTGQITFKNAPDYETKTSYAIIVTVNDGIQSVAQNITVNILNISEVPILENLTLSINENLEPETIIGNINIINVGDSAITSFTLDGIGSDVFDITATGYIKTKAGAIINYETKNSYLLNVIATNSTGDSEPIVISIAVIDINDAPIISSANFYLNENSINIGTILASDADNDILTYSISGGSDSSKFNINSSTGELNFNFVTNYELPSDSDSDNIYQVEVTVSDADTHSSQLINVEIEDLELNIYSYRDINTLSGAIDAISIDLDGDNNNDIIAIGDNEIYWYKNDGHENFTSHLVSEDTYSFSHILQAIDYDNDGDIDIVSSGSTICWYENDGHENFTSHLIEENFGTNIVSDIDNDGDIDYLNVYTTINTNHGLSLYWQEQKNTNYTSHLISEESSDFSSGSNYTNAVDIDNDGDTDIIWSFYTTLSNSTSIKYYIYWYENDGFNNFTNKHKVVESHNSLSVYFCADINKDNHTEIIYPRTETNIYTNIYSDIFSFSSIYGSIKIFDIEDINGDQNKDIIIRQGSTNKNLRIYAYDGTSSFAVSNIVLKDSTTLETINMTSATIRDINSDGKTDILSTFKTINKITWYKNIGDVN